MQLKRFAQYAAGLFPAQRLKQNPVSDTFVEHDIQCAFKLCVGGEKYARSVRVTVPDQPHEIRCGQAGPLFANNCADRPLVQQFQRFCFSFGHQNAIFLAGQTFPQVNIDLQRGAHQQYGALNIGVSAEMLVQIDEFTENIDTFIP
jgi:hypothetical protein